jgi:hypothetical protein
MAAMPELSQELLDQISEFIREPHGSTVCSEWKETLYESLHIAARARFNRRVHTEGEVIFRYGATRELGSFDESVVYSFNFKADGTYRMQWARTMGECCSMSEQHFGSWRFVLDQVHCETLDPFEAAASALEAASSLVDPSELEANLIVPVGTTSALEAAASLVDPSEANIGEEVPYAPAGYRFLVPIKDILEANGSYVQALLGSPAAPWELPARVGSQCST